MYWDYIGHAPKYATSWPQKQHLTRQEALYCYWSVDTAIYDCRPKATRLISLWILLGKWNRTLLSEIRNSVDTKNQGMIMNSMKLVILLLFISRKGLQTMLSHHNARVNSHLRWKQTAVLRLLSSLVWIDQYNECNRMTSFMGFMTCTCWQVRNL